jgi:hypothetical protein
VSRMVAHPALPLDQIGYAPGRPQAGVISQGFGAAREPALDASEIARRQPGFAAGAPGFLQRRPSSTFELLRPATHRLSMDADLPRHLGLRDPLLQQPRRLQSARFQRLEIPSHPSWISHASDGST